MDGSRFAAGLWVFAQSEEKHGGYDSTFSVNDQIKLAASVPGLKGIELIAPAHVSRENVKQVKTWLEDAGLIPISVNPYMWTEPIWKRGAFTSPDPKVRRAAIDTAKLAVDIGHELGTRQMCLWPGEDGWDYHFQVDYRQIWDWTAQALDEIGRYDLETRIGYEYKHNEPRTHSLVSNAAKAALLGYELGLPNIGAYLDFGHALMSREIPAEAAVMLARLNRLVGVHVNDTYGTGDDDMAVGAVHFWGMLEFLLALDEVGYGGWLTLDLVPKRESAVGACARSIANMRTYMKLISKLDRVALKGAQANQDALEAQRLVQELIAGD
jgi:sugar phosphate isomerase/epimerase